MGRARRCIRGGAARCRVAARAARTFRALRRRSRHRHRACAWTPRRNGRDRGLLRVAGARVAARRCDVRRAAARSASDADNRQRSAPRATGASRTRVLRIRRRTSVLRAASGEPLGGVRGRRVHRSRARAARRVSGRRAHARHIDCSGREGRVFVGRAGGRSDDGHLRRVQRRAPAAAARPSLPESREPDRGRAVRRDGSDDGGARRMRAAARLAVSAGGGAGLCRAAARPCAVGDRFRHSARRGRRRIRHGAYSGSDGASNPRGAHGEAPRLPRECDACGVRTGCGSRSGTPHRSRVPRSI